MSVNLFCLAAFAIANQVDVPPSQSKYDWLTSHDTTQEVLTWLNSHRRRHGRKALVLDAEMSFRSWNHSMFMTQYGQMHSRNSGPEIVFVGPNSVESAMYGFSRSFAHNGIMLGSSFSSVGIGVAKKYGRYAWTLNFR